LALHGILLLAGVYGSYTQVDAFMHLLGGLAVGLSAGGLLWRARVNTQPQPYDGLLLIASVIGAVAVIAIAWEVFEFVCDAWLGTQFQKSIGDTIKDQVLGVAGGTVGALVTTRRDDAR
jgi:hypothetical protein